MSVKNCLDVKENESRRKSVASDRRELFESLHEMSLEKHGRGLLIY